MKLAINTVKYIINRTIRRKTTGESIKIFCEHMGIVYIKLGQILAVQNLPNVISAEERQEILNLCDNCNPIKFGKIKHKIPHKELYKHIYKKPIGSASVSQVHKAVLKNGEIVALKIKRDDISKNIEKDIKQIQFILKHFGKIVKVRNKQGSLKGISLYLDWIKEETDFKHEQLNIERYRQFAESVSTQKAKIVVPKLYKELSTDEVIVMEFIESPTLDKIEHTSENSVKIIKALSNYLQLSFKALFSNQVVVFHGDPHEGNIFIDKNNNIGFLDMGLIFELTPEDAKLTKDFFLGAYFGDTEGLYSLLLPYLKISQSQKAKFKQELDEYCRTIKSKPITHYFMDMVWVCLNYDVVPPKFLFCMAKAFICLYGIDTTNYNGITGHELLNKQVTGFILEQILDTGKDLINSSMNIAHAVLVNDKDKIVDTIENCSSKIQNIVSIIKKVKEQQ